MGGGARRARVFGERGLIADASRIRELVLGVQGGVLVPLAVVTELAGAEAAEVVHVHPSSTDCSCVYSATPCPSK